MKRNQPPPVVVYSVWPSLAPRPRQLLVALGLVLGLALQALTLSAWPGVPFLFASVLLSWIAGHDNRIDRRSFHHDRAWEAVPFDRVARIREHDRAMRRWDSSVFDVSSGLGFTCFALTAVALLVVAIAVAASGMERIAIIIGVDGALLILLQWFNGMRTIHRQTDLLVKVDHLLAITRKAGQEIESRGKLEAQLLMEGRGDNRIPIDVKLAMQLEGAPEHFLGVQGQVVLNRVQGTPYPYFYCVVVARSGHGLLSDSKHGDLPDGVIRETKEESDVEVVILRQRTTKTSGYHTRPAQSVQILKTALQVAESFVLGAREKA